MKIYEVTGFDKGANRYTYFEPTRDAAQARKRAMRAEQECSPSSIKIEPIEVVATKEGIAKALQRAIDGFCVNEH